MENNYQYVDPDFTYTNANGVLHNLAKIDDEKVFHAVSEELSNDINNFIKCINF